MKIIPFAQQALRKLALIGLLFSPLVLTPSYAAELVGKPVAVGSRSAAVSSASTSSEVQAEANQFEHVEEPPVAAEPPAPPPPAEFAHENIQHAMDDLEDDFGGLSLNPDVIIPLVAILLLFGGPVLLVIVLAFFHYRAKARRQQNINMNIDKLLAAGRDIPVELLLGEEATVIKTQVKGETIVYERNDVLLEKGVKNVCVGIGLLVFLTIFVGIKLGSCAFILIGLGISRLIIWKLSGQRAEAAPKPETIRVQE